MDLHHCPAVEGIEPTTPHLLLVVIMCAAVPCCRSTA